jgi:site-specific DNA recombinase
MTVILGSDAAGETLKNIIKEYLLANDYDVNDVTDVTKDFVDNTLAVAAGVNAAEGNLGIMIDAYGAGSFMTATKVKGMVAAEVSDERSAYMTRAHNNARMITMGIQYRYQQGEVRVNCSRFLGYTKDKNKKLVIVPEEAEVVKRIYREYLEGNSMLKIKRGLEADGILNGAGNKIWHTSNISKILRNEKYIGDALLQKTYTVDFLTKKRVKNNGLIPQYYVENNHEPIIPKDIYMQVQEELAKRRSPYTSPSGNKRTYSSNHCFANIVICGTCKEIYRRVHWNNRGKKSIVWRCVSRLENTGQFCDARTVHEKDIEESIIKAINNILNKKDCYLPILKNNIASVLNNEKNKELDNIENKLNDLQQKLLSLVHSSSNYDDIAEEIHQLRDKKQDLLLKNARQEEVNKRIEEMTNFLNEQDTTLIEHDETLVRRIIEKVWIYEDKFTIEFKSGITVNVNG